MNDRHTSIFAPAAVRGIVRETSALSVDGGTTWTDLGTRERPVVVSVADGATIEIDRLRAAGGER